MPLVDPVVTRKVGLIRRRGRTLTPAAQQLYALCFELRNKRQRATAEAAAGSGSGSGGGTGGAGGAGGAGGVMAAGRDTHR